MKPGVYSVNNPIYEQNSTRNGGNSICPSGMECLLSVNQIIVKQKTEILEVLTGFETCNQYQLLNASGQPLYYAIERSNCCSRNCCCSSQRAFRMDVIDTAGKEAIHFKRPCRCQNRLCGCMGQRLKVYSPRNFKIGSVVQTCSVLAPSFDICDVDHNVMLHIRGPTCFCAHCFSVDFRILSKDFHEIGRISKHWSGLAKELFTDADNFGINFPIDLDVRMKGCLIGATMLIDYMFYEEGT